MSVLKTEAAVAYLSAPSSFLGVFAKLQKATISFVMSPSVRPSVRPSSWNSSAPTGRILMKFDI